MTHPFAVHLASMSYKRRKAVKNAAMLRAAEHDISCDCCNCMLNAAVIGTLEEHGPFEVDDLNDVRASLGYPTKLLSENDLYGSHSGSSNEAA